MALRFVELIDGAVAHPETLPPDCTLRTASIGGHRGYVDLGCPGRAFVLAVVFGAADASAAGQPPPITVVVAALPAQPEDERIRAPARAADADGGAHGPETAFSTPPSSSSATTGPGHGSRPSMLKYRAMSTDLQLEDDLAALPVATHHDGRRPRSGSTASTGGGPLTGGTTTDDEDDAAGQQHPAGADAVSALHQGLAARFGSGVSSSSSQAANLFGMGSDFASSESAILAIAPERDAVTVALRRAKLDAARMHDLEEEAATAAPAAEEEPAAHTAEGASSDDAHGAAQASRRRTHLRLPEELKAELQRSPNAAAVASEPLVLVPPPAVASARSASAAPPPEPASEASTSGSPWTRITPAGTALVLYTLAGLPGRTWTYPEAPACTDRLPLHDRPDSELPLALPMFCQPSGAF